MPPKTAANWLFNDKRRYLVNGCLIKKLAFFNKQLHVFIISLTQNSLYYL